MKKIEPCTNCDGSCSKCGNCCTIAIPITKEEEKTIKQYIEEHDVQPESLYEEDNFYAYCCFYDRKNKCCKIYDVRPEICRSFKCNRDINQLEQEKIANHKRAYWNHMDENNNLSNFTTFDLLFYSDPRPIIDLIFRLHYPVDKKKYNQILKMMKEEWGLEELANSLVSTFDD